MRKISLMAPVIGMPIVSCTTRIGDATKSRVFADTQPKVVMNALAKQPFAALDLCERFGVKTTTARTASSAWWRPLCSAIRTSICSIIASRQLAKNRRKNSTWS